MKQDTYFLLQALAAAEVRRGYCAPNPAVGAVLVRNNQIIATGNHFAAGHDHAEIAALKALGGSAKGATLYVTLEPCCHFGKTPPCSDAIIAAGIKRVVYGLVDPNPQVAGKSALQLQAADIECSQLALPEISQFYQSYVYWRKHNRPWVTAKLAMSLDGKIAGMNGVPTAITGAELRDFTHQWRHRSDAILTTVKTVQRDNPKLNVRLNEQTVAKPIYILDSALQFPLTSCLLTTAQSVTLFYNEALPQKLQQLQQANIRCIKVSRDAMGLSLSEVLACMGHDGLQDVWVEAGGHCFAALHAQQLVQRTFIYMSLKWLGEEAIAAFHTTPGWFDAARTVQWQSMGKDALCEITW